MPLLHIAMRSGKPEAYRQAIFDSLYQALRDALHVPEHDQFMTITEHAAANFRYGPYLSIARSDDLLYIQITVFDTRTAQEKAAFFRRAVDLLAASPGVRPEDVFINVLEAARENWSLGHGVPSFT